MEESSSWLCFKEWPEVKSGCIFLLKQTLNCGKVNFKDDKRLRVAFTHARVHRSASFLS